MLTPDGSEWHLAEGQSKHKQKIFHTIDYKNKKKWTKEIHPNLARLVTTLFKQDLLSYDYDTDLPPLKQTVLSCHKSIFFDYYQTNYSEFVTSAMVGQLSDLGCAIEAFTWQDFPACIPANAVVVIPDYQIDTNYTALAWLAKNLISIKLIKKCKIILLQTENYQVSRIISNLVDIQFPLTLSWRKQKLKGIKTALDLCTLLKQTQILP